MDPLPRRRGEVTRDGKARKRKRHLRTLAFGGLLVVIGAAACGSSTTESPKLNSPPQDGGVYAGYALSGPTSGSGTVQFAVPRLPCSGYESGVDIGVVADVTSAATGSGEIEATVTVECLHGSQYTSSLLTRCLPTGCHTIGDLGVKPIQVRPGDVIVASLQVSPTSSRVSLSDLTDHETTSLTGGGGVLQRVLDGMTLGYRAEGTPMSLPAFGELRFTKAAIDGKNLRSARAIALNMDSPPFAAASTGPLTSQADAWTEIYRQANNVG
jgi:hypothetical protein